jgi:predicted SnoaL-like aldol condensation-catalyzing enzyme
MMMMMMMTTTATDKRTGKRVTLKTADLFRIENAMIVKHWDVIDASEMA